MVDGHVWLQSKAIQVIIVNYQGGLKGVGRAGRSCGTSVCQGCPVQTSCFSYRGGASVPVEVAKGVGL